MVWCSHPGLRSRAPQPSWFLPNTTGWQRGHSLSPSSLVLRLTFRVLLECPDSPRVPPGPMDPAFFKKSILPWGLWFFDAFRSGQRPTPGLPHRAVLRLQTFSVSWRFIPSTTFPTLFRVGNALELSPSEVFPLRPRSTPLDVSCPSCRFGHRIIDVPRLQGLMRGRRVRSDCVGVTRAQPADPLLAFYPPRSIPPRSWPRLRLASSHGLRHELTTPRCCVSYLLCRVSKNRGVIPGHLRLELPPWAFLSSSRSPKFVACRTPEDCAL